jgi:4-diphosphocytidyl-2-C-methyl-D-erythritol kinase
MVINSYAKINLFLEITGKDNADGYHYIDSIFQEITLCDTIEINDSLSDRVVFIDENGQTLSDDGLSRSTVHKALDLFKTRFGITDNFEVIVNKTIPVGAGLGGGSSNAGNLLCALAEKYGINRTEILKIAPEIGSDVPFFAFGGLCRVSGKGEIIAPLDSVLDDVEFIVVYPGFPVSTRVAYSFVENFGDAKGIEFFMKKSSINIDFLEDFVYNRFQCIVIERDNRLSAIKSELDKRLKARFSFMSGSGSSLVFVYKGGNEAKSDFDILRNSDFAVIYPGARVFHCFPVYK